MNAVAIAILALALAATDARASSKDRFIAEMTERLLAGREAPKDLETRLLALEPAERFEVVVFLRRSGLLRGAPLPVDRLLDVPTGAAAAEGERQ
ncbi:hypothetical protein [uncultured Paracoccus sp.]|uniref:hypothetical protein n=1 Tax=uncultured Paracoccus sp. TaxID=189685 RepID=UPI0025FEE885|nr:hypothetical protein [uncultured Paracoccus sp.]